MKITLFRCIALTAVISSATTAATLAGDRPAPGAKIGRSPVVATQGIVATSQPLAAAAGLRVLQDGELGVEPNSVAS